jgi:hypothetical protein
MQLLFGSLCPTAGVVAFWVATVQLETFGLDRSAVSLVATWYLREADLFAS